MEENVKRADDRRKFSDRRNSVRARRALRMLWVLLIGIALGALGLAFVLAGEIYEYQDTVDGVHLPKVDAIVVLAGGRGRIAGAGDIWYRYWELTHRVVPIAGGRDKVPDAAESPLLYLSGMGPQSTWRVLMTQLRRGVRDVIQPENVVIEKESFNTDANARWLARYASQHHWERILLITSPYHMKRARFIFEKISQAGDVPIAIETLSIFQEPYEPGEWRHGLQGIRVTMIEYLKWVYYRYFWHPEEAKRV